MVGNDKRSCCLRISNVQVMSILLIMVVVSCCLFVLYIHAKERIMDDVMLELSQNHLDYFLADKENAKVYGIYELFCVNMKDRRIHGSAVATENADFLICQQKTDLPLSYESNGQADRVLL